MKKIRLLVLFLGIILIVSGLITMFIFSDKKNNTNNKQDEVIEIDPKTTTYISCSQNKKQSNKKVGSISVDYQYTSRYEFSVYQNKITWGNLLWVYKFDTLADYNNHLKITTFDDEVEKIDDPDNLIRTYQRYAIIHTTSMDYSDDYLEKLKNDGYSCKITRES